MPTLANELRNKLERVVIEARDVAEVGARTALEALAVHHYESYSHMKPAQRLLRNHLRARAKQHGDVKDERGRYASIDHLVLESAYEHWHRMLFARFLAENNLLIEPQENIAISLEEAEELAKETGEDVWTYASRCAQRMLPQIFRPDDPLLAVSFASEHMLKLERLLDSLLPAVFTASDALGWVYQFWQSKKKDQVNRSEVKIGADEISAVTQLFTEPYMVEFLLHNTLGAWWAGKRLTAEDAENTENEEKLRQKVALPGVTWGYLRFVRDGGSSNQKSEIENRKSRWRPAAGTFDGWPKTAAELKVLDPCCGSGHFLVAALHHLVPIRMAEEGLSAVEAVDAVLRENLHGLEIDERCCQIAAFALAFEAWKMAGYRELPGVHIACTGIGPQCSAEQWLKLAEQSGIPLPTVGHEAIKNGLLNLHRLFSQASTLGSLINPTELPSDLIAADYETIQPYLAAILKAEKADDETRERVIAAAGMVKAADLLARDYTLVITNVPYLARKSHCEVLMAWADENCRHARADLATLMIWRLWQMLVKGGAIAVVCPRNWLFLGRYKELRTESLRTQSWHFLAELGPGAFDTISGDVVNTALATASVVAPLNQHTLWGIDVSERRGAATKAHDLVRIEGRNIPQKDMRNSPDSRIVVAAPSDANLLGDLCQGLGGTTTGDSLAFRRCFWEITDNGRCWSFQQGTVKDTAPFGGREYVLFWEDGEGVLASRSQGGGVTIAGREAWEQEGVAVTYTGDLPATLYVGNLYENVIAVLLPRRREHLAAIWTYCESDEFRAAVRAIDKKWGVTCNTLVKVPFDLAHWQNVATEKYPDGLPEPESNDPTQWLFHGRPEESTNSLQVAVARLLDYRWPAELDDKMRLSKRARVLIKRCDELAKFADDDGIVCIPSVRGEEPAAERLLTLVDACGIKPETVRELAGGSDLDEWLRKDFFEEHCKLFHNRPFVWHIWDGRQRDGFHALVNYHKLAEGNGKGRKVLESLTYSYLYNWITRQKDEVKRGEGGAEDRLAAALELKKRLEAILAGEPPYDIFVRWKPLHEQPIGWEPDINDGVRMNIRPFLASDIPGGKKGAGILRWKPNIKWGKDRGKEPKRPKEEYPWFWGWDEKTTDFMGTGKEPDGNRWNACHYKNKAKQAARDAAEKGNQ